AFVVALAGAAVPAAHAQPRCPSLQVNRNDPHYYRPRGAYCEGKYVQLDGGTVLRVVSLTEAGARIDARPGGQVAFSWPPPAPENVSLRVRSLDPALLYQMDKPPLGTAETSFRWPLDGAADARLRADRVGILGWTRMPVYGRPQIVYLLVRVDAGAASPNPPQLTVLPEEELSSLTVTVLRVDGGREIPVGERRLRPPFHPRQPVVFRIPTAGPGLYHVLLSAGLLDGRTWPDEIWYLHR
ncbi:MAG TPA: hypothetical protein VF006_21540, partial [Longimicrobium sp.]